MTVNTARTMGIEVCTGLGRPDYTAEARFRSYKPKRTFTTAGSIYSGPPSCEA